MFEKLALHHRPDMAVRQISDHDKLQVGGQLLSRLPPVPTSRMGSKPEQSMIENWISSWQERWQNLINITRPHETPSYTQGRDEEFEKSMQGVDEDFVDNPSLQYDDTTQLSTEIMKDLIENCKDLVIKRKLLSASALHIWRYNNKKKKENIFFEPLISRTCVELQNLSSKDLISLTLEREYVLRGRSISFVGAPKQKSARSKSDAPKNKQL